MENVGERLKRLRKSHDLTQEQLAKKLDLEAPAVSKYETNRVPIPQEHIIKLSKIFDVSTDYLLGISDSPTQKQEKKEFTFATHLDEDLSEEAKQDVLDYLEFVRQREKKKNK